MCFKVCSCKASFARLWDGGWSISASVDANHSQLVPVREHHCALIAVATVVRTGKDGGALFIEVETESSDGYFVRSDQVTQ